MLWKIKRDGIQIGKKKKKQKTKSLHKHKKKTKTLDSTCDILALVPIYPLSLKCKHKCLENKEFNQHNYEYFTKKFRLKKSIWMF